MPSWFLLRLSICHIWHVECWMNNIYFVINWFLEYGMTQNKIEIIYFFLIENKIFINYYILYLNKCKIGI